MHQYIVVERHHQSHTRIVGFYRTEREALDKAKYLSTLPMNTLEFWVAKFIIQIVPPSNEPTINRFE